MAITVKHLKVSTVPDAGDDTLVEPSDWNADHQLTGTVPVANGGTGAATLTGYVKGNGTANMTASATIPSTDVTGLGSMATQNSNNISVTGGTMSGVAITGYIPTTEKAQPLGVATLDAAGKVPTSQIPMQGDLNYQGTWNASTNTPTLTSSVGTKGYYYVVDVAGSTNLNGITDWQIGDWAIFNGTVWQKVDNTDAVTSVNGQVGTVVLTTTNIAEGTNLYYTDARSRASVSAGTGISYNSTTGVITNASPSLGGDVVGPASATDNAIARYDSTTGKLIQNSVVTVGDTGIVAGASISGASNTLSNIGNAALTNSAITINGTTTSLGGSINVGTVTSVSGTAGRITSTGGATPVIDLASGIATAGTTGSSALIPVVTIDTYGRVTSITTAANPQGTVTSVTGTAPVVSSGGATPAISMAAATTSVNGYLTSTDWNTFNNKASTALATATVAGLVELGDNTVQTVAANAVSATASRSYALQLNAAGQGVINVPWTDTNSGGTVTSVGGTGTVNGITLTGTVTTSGNLTLGGTLSGVNLTTQVTGTLPIANGGTNATTAPAALTNLRGWTTTATAAGTTTLTNTSTTQQNFTGSTTQTLVLPVTSTLALGWAFKVINNSTGTITVNSSGGNLVGTVIAGTTASIVCSLTSGTTAASWDFDIDGFATETGTGSVVRATSPTLVSPALGTPTALVGTNITGTASGLSIGGNAATVTNGVVTTGSYADPTWITSLEGSKITGTIDGGTF